MPTIVRKCIQCGAQFELSNKEYKFFIGKGLNIPKRCAECRKTNKEKQRK
ncbi:MAG: zinc-ribbon domain-containing protein [Elusimicrobiota bacterium]|jgi:predicted RNA-binding Zn-ribbon protein involved in translation (DUF1610 family)|nr:zinc-ribbon domain-containing protein [Elusimicrobiota bacterium]